MKWEIYKLLTPEEKEEFDYKFEEEGRGLLSCFFGKIFLNLYFFIWVSLASFFSFSNYIGSEVTEIHKEVFSKFFLDLLNLGVVLLIIVGILFIADILFYQLDYMTEKKWIDKRIYTEIINGKRYYKRKEVVEE